MLLLLVYSTTTFAQNGIIGAGFTDGWNSPSNIVYFDQGAGTSRIKTINPKGTGDQYFRLVRAWIGNNTEYGTFNCSSIDWNNPGVIYGMSSCVRGAFYITSPNITDNYVFKTPNGNTVVDLLYFRVQGAVRNVASVSQSPFSTSVTPNVSVSVTATLNDVLNEGQAVYLRYTTNNYSSSTVVQMTGSGTSFSASIPSGINTANANVSYYVFTSGDNTVQINVNGSNSDLYTINLNNNNGSNYFNCRSYPMDWSYKYQLVHSFKLVK